MVTNIQGQCGIIRFGRHFTYYIQRTFPTGIGTLERVWREHPHRVCGNKVDVKSACWYILESRDSVRSSKMWHYDFRKRKVKTGAVTFHRKKNLQYFEISAKSNYNFEKPFLLACEEARRVSCLGNMAMSDFHASFFCLCSNGTLEFVAAPAPSLQLRFRSTPR